MSIDAISMALRATVPGASNKFVLVALANYAGEEMTSYPSIERLCRDTSLNRKTVIRALGWLKENGFISDTGMRKGSTHGVIVYRLDAFIIGTEIGTYPKNGTSTKFTSKQSQIYAEAVPDLRGSSPKNGTQNHQGIFSEPPVNPAPKKPARFDPMAIDLPDCIPEDAWGRWITYRRQRKLSTTEQTAFAQIEKLVAWRGKGHSPPKIIDESIANGWQGLFEPKVGGANNASTRESVIAAFTGSGQRQPAILEGYSERLVGSG